MQLTIDHVAIGARTLEQGAATLRVALGVELPPGGTHPLMGTHNRLARLGEGSFVEIIAIDPDAPAPARPRWFTLDAPATRARLAERARPLCWVVATDDLDALLAASPVALGEPVALSRGDLAWRLTVPPDGRLPGAGLLPAFIEWAPGAHPRTRMADLGLTLARIELGTPAPDALRGQLAALGVGSLATVYRHTVPCLRFRVRRPDGVEVALVS